MISSIIQAPFKIKNIALVTLYSFGLWPGNYDNAINILTLPMYGLNDATTVLQS